MFDHIRSCGSITDRRGQSQPDSVFMAQCASGFMVDGTCKAFACVAALCLFSASSGQTHEAAAGQAKIDEAIRAAAQFETIFTMRQFVINGKKSLLIDRVIKGNVDAVKFAHAQLAAWHDIDSGRLIVFMDVGVARRHSAVISKHGVVEFSGMDSKEYRCNLDDLIREIDEAPHSVAARLKRAREKASEENAPKVPKVPSGKPRPEPQRLQEGQPSAKPGT